MAIISPFRATFPRLDKVYLTDAFFENIKALYPVFLQNGYYDTDNLETLYVYQQQKGDKYHTGIIGCMNIDQYLKGNMVRHEQTLAAKEEKQLRLLYERTGLIKPVMLVHPTSSAISDFLQRYTREHERWYSVQYRGAKNIFWRVADPADAQFLQTLFAEHVAKTYIADGHHRAAMMTKHYYTRKAANPTHTGSEPYNYILAAFFSADEIQVQDYNRVINDLGSYSPLGFLAALSKVFEIEPTHDQHHYRPAERGTLGLCINGEWFGLRWREHILEKYAHAPAERRLDVGMLNIEVLQNILDIQDIREDARVEYVEGNKGVEGVMEKVKTLGEKGVGFMLYPIPFEELMQIADSGVTLPPKSTYFLPRLYNGMMTYRIDI